MTYVRNKHRALFISDMHLGSVHCKVERLLAFLRDNSADVVYLVGDVIDHPIQLVHLPKLHVAVIRHLTAQALQGSLIIYTPGNHDSMFRNYVGQYGNLTIALVAEHQAKNSKSYLVTHGDETDMFGIKNLLTALVLLERYLPISMWEVLRKFSGKCINAHTKKYEQKLRQEAKGYDGVICGHVHYPRLTDDYKNCGDWTHHCTAIVETRNGEFQLLKG